MQAKVPGVDFCEDGALVHRRLSTPSIKRDMTRHFPVDCSRIMTAKKYTKKCDARAKLLVCLIKLLVFFFDVLIAIAVVVAKVPCFQRMRACQLVGTKLPSRLVRYLWSLNGPSKLRLDRLKIISRHFLQSNLSNVGEVS